jgi:M6 family metalloprotease-like protein
MRYFISLIIICHLCNSLFAQTNSENGYWNPNRGEIRVLLVYAELLNDPNYSSVTQPGWPAGQMPLDPGKYFDSQVSTNPSGYITRYFSNASYGEYKVIGDYYPSLIQLDYNNISSTNYFSKVIEALNNTVGADLLTAHNFSINNHDFDKWSNYNFGTEKLESPDNLNDMIIVLYRVNSYITGTQNPGTNTGSVNPSAINLTLKNSSGFNCRSNFVSFNNDAEVIMRHEFSHSIYGGNNFHTAGCGAGTRTFLSSVGGYSNMSSWDSNSQGCNGWDRWRMGWKNPNKQHLISAYNASNNNEIDFENYSIQNNPLGGEYILRDFSSTGDAIRIKLPKVDNNALPQYLWLENHAQQNEFGFQNGLGLFAYIQVGKENKSNMYFSEESSPGNYLFPLPASGRFDFNFNIPNKLIDLDNSLPNPLSGYHFLMRQAIDGIEAIQGQIASNENELFLANKVKINNQIINHYPTFGNSTDPFKLNGNNTISISSNPSSQVISTYKNSTQLPDINNKSIHLSGLSIQILNEDAYNDYTNALKIKIRWDEYKINNDVRWCGDIVLHPSIHFSAANLPLDDINERSLDIQPYVTLLLDRGKSPTQHVSYEEINGEHIFTKPTYFTATENSYIYQNNGSTIHVDNKSTLQLESGCKLEMDNGSQLLVTNGSTLIIDDNALLLMHEAYLYIDESSTLIIRNSNPDAGLVLGDLVSTPTNALIEIYGTLRYENGAPMVYKGSGRYEFIGAEAVVIFDDPVNSYVEFTGPYFAFPALTLRDGAQITMNTAIISLSSLLIEVHQHATLNLTDAENIMIQDVHMNGYEISDANHTALNIENVWNLEMGACRFNQDALASMQNALKISGIPLTSVFALYDIRIDRSLNPLALSDGDYMKCSNLFINLLGNPQSDNLITLRKITKSIIKESVLKYGNTGINISGFNNALNNILYLDKTDITDTHTGIDSKGSQLFLRNGSSIKSVVNGIVAEGNVLYDGDNNPITYNSMITLGDIGCANILQFTNYGIWATNTLLNMDANLHAIANQSNPVPNSLVRASAGTGAFIKLCYPNKNPLASIIPTTIYASGNYWGGITLIAPGGNQAPDFDVRKYGNHACVGLNYNIIPVLTDPLTTCSVIHNDCESCEPVTNDDEGASQNVLIGNAYKMLYGNFTPLDTTYTRNPFEEISVLRLALDTLTNIWTVYDLENNPYTVSERSVHRILTSRVLLPLTNTANARKHIRNIFEHFNISDTDADHLFSLYPNPANQTIHLASSYSGNIQVSLYDIQGRVIFNSEFEEYINSYPINIEGLTDGIYCVRIIDCKQQLIDKLTFIKAH